MAKQAVQIPKKKRTKYRFQRLKMCKKCSSYSVLEEETCPKCGSVYIGVERLGRSLYKNRLFTEAVIILIFVCGGIVLAPTIQSLYYSLIAGLLFCLMFVLLTLLYQKSEYHLQLKKLFLKDLRKIEAGIAFDSERAKEDSREEKVAGAYVKLREIGEFIHSDQLKIRQIMVLNDIVLRNDMELELENLVPNGYDKDFVIYALELLKINRKLFTKKAIAYFIDYRHEVLEDFGTEALTAVAGTTVRMKLYLLEFSDFIEEFLSFFPKERLLRVCSIIQAHPEENWGSLKTALERIVELNYGYDPDFKPYLERSAVYA